MRIALATAVALLTVTLVGSAPAAPRPIPAERAALKGIARALERGWIDPAAARRYRADVSRAARLVRNLPEHRSRVVLASLTQAASLSGKLTAPRALIAFGQLRITSRELAKHGPPRTQTDVTDEDGIVYRYFPSAGYAFHPLGSFAALNAASSRRDAEGAHRLAKALVERGAALRGGGLGFEYAFRYSGGRPPWLSGMAQAVAAQALANAAAVSEDSSLNLAARAAFRAIPGRLVLSRPSGPWIRLYAFNRLVVLNAQLQSIVSLRAYARRVDDAAAASLADRMEDAVARELHRFDTGYWTLYSLPRNPSPLHYQRYVEELLRRLGGTDRPAFTAAADRFAAYERQPPAFRLGDGGVGGVRFWLSKPATVSLRAVGRPKRLTLEPGWHTVRWKLPRRAGIWAVDLTARDGAGNRVSIDALPIVRVAAPPKGTRGTKTRDEAAVAAPRAGAPAAASARPFAVGGGVDDPDDARLAARTYGAARLAVAWPAGATAPDPAATEALRALPQASRAVLEIVADPLPADDAGRSALAAFAVELARQTPGLDDLLLGPAPSAATADAYVRALAAVRDALSSGGLTVRVAARLEGARAPQATLAALGRSAAALGRAGDLLDELAFRPAGPGAGGFGLDDLSQLAAALRDAFGDPSSGASPEILVVGLATQTSIPQEKRGAYAPLGRQTGAVDEQAQAGRYAEAIRAAGCRPDVNGVMLERLVDGTDPGQQSGLYYADGSPKASAEEVSRAAAASAGGAARACPGVGVPVGATTLVFPQRLRRSGGPVVRLACDRDCLYLVTLDREDGKPVLARRGAARGGRVASVRLPKVPIAPGAYTFSVRLVAQTNPGTLTIERSDPVVLG